jgi:hypothetical protein
MASGSSTEQGSVSVTGSACLRKVPMHIGAAVSKNTGCGHRRSERVWEGTAAKRATLDADTMRSRAQIKTMTSDTRAETPRWCWCWCWCWCCCSHPCLLGRSTPTPHPHTYCTAGTCRLVCRGPSNRVAAWKPLGHVCVCTHHLLSAAKMVKSCSPK